MYPALRLRAAPRFPESDQYHATPRTFSPGRGLPPLTRCLSSRTLLLPLTSPPPPIYHSMIALRLLYSPFRHSRRRAYFTAAVATTTTLHDFPIHARAVRCKLSIYTLRLTHSAPYPSRSSLAVSRFTASFEFLSLLRFLQHARWSCGSMPG